MPTLNEPDIRPAAPLTSSPSAIAFASLGVAELPKGSVHVITVATSALVMAVCLVLTKRLNAPWLREWGLGISIIVGLIVAYFAHGAGLGPAA
jgi:small neutral amino acid transporter SnatA (MarC family)